MLQVPKARSPWAELELQPCELCCGRSHGLWPRRRCARCGRSRRVQCGVKGIGVRLVEHGTHQERPATAHVSERDASSACVAAMKLKLPTLESSVSRQVQTPWQRAVRLGSDVDATVAHELGNKTQLRRGSGGRTPLA